jgi:predicted nucleic acid-binding protein
MSRIFADTSFYVALVNARDVQHPLAQDFSRTFRGIVVTTDFVLVELGNWLSRSGDRGVFVRLLEQLQGDPNILIHPAHHDLFQQGFALFKHRPDKDWSFTDCISFVVMQSQGLTEALTADHHFEQAGFTALLKR